jgi:Iron-containing redox enzyme
MAFHQVVRPFDRSLEPLHRRLAEFNRLRLQPRFDVEDWQQHLRQEMELRTVEGHVVEAERARARAEAETAPTQPRELVSWLEQQRERFDAQSQGLYPWLSQRASRREMSWFLAQELDGEQRFEDLLSLTQLEQSRRAKLEMARNQWDEMGQGNASATRAHLLACLEGELLLDATHPPAWECLARSNLMMGLACNRRYAFQAIGALGLLEATAGRPASALDAGLARLGVSAEARGFFAVRQRLAPLRAHAWYEHVVVPLVAQDARCARAIAEGALMRLAADARCHRRYLAALDVPGQREER